MRYRRIPGGENSAVKPPLQEKQIRDPPVRHGSAECCLEVGEGGAQSLAGMVLALANTSR